MSTDQLIKDDVVTFEVQSLSSSRLVWLDSEFFQELEPLEILGRYAYASSKSPCFSSVEFDLNSVVLAGAEPYGGQGVGGNGGGGRCANIGEMQVKGVGANPLVGDHDNEEHSYGGLDLRKATIEAVYSTVLDKLLPKGVVGIRALIFIGYDCAKIGAHTAWGGLMVRDQCARPGHFMRSPYFTPRNGMENVVKDDLVRIRALYKRMSKDFKGDSSAFIRWIGSYLRDVADQFAFARVMRISHGTMTASNISWRGRWLDLPACSFLTGGVNYNIWSQFYEEHNMALSYALEIFHNYSKFNGVALNPAPLVSYFYEQFQEYGKYYVGYALGIDLECVLDLPERPWSQVTDNFLRVIHSGKCIEPRRPNYDSKDPVIALIAAFFMACAGSNAFGFHARRAGLSETEAVQFRGASAEVWSAYRRIKCVDSQKAEPFLKRSFLIAMKRALLSEIWYLPNVEGQVTEICSQGTPEDIGPYIDKHKEVSSWVFKECAGEVTLFKGGNQSACYLAKEGKFAIFNNGSARYFECYDEFQSDVRRNLIFVDPVIYDFALFFDRLGLLINDFNENGTIDERAKEEYV